MHSVFKLLFFFAAGFFSLISLYSFGQTYQVEDVSVICTPHMATGLNSKYNDFSPVVVNNQLVFTSGRETDLVLSGENNWKKIGYLNLFSVDLKKDWSDTTDYKNIHAYSQVIRTKNHTGPCAFSASGDTIFYTQVEPKKKGRNGDRKPQLYTGLASGSEWTQLTLLPFNQQEYSFGHPAWDTQTNTLYFVSDMPGGVGGKDIYRVKWDNGNWGHIENVSEVNSEFDEMFPCVVQGDIYFSSNRPGGFGEMDFYWKILGSGQPIKNIESLNTAADEVAIFVSPDRKKGFYSSSINGNDDIFFFYMQREITVSNELAGQFTYRNLNGMSSGLKVQLYSEEGELLFEETTDQNGEFKFKQLPGVSYTIKAISEQDLELSIYDADGTVTTQLLRDGDGAFQYKKINYASAGTLSFMDESMMDFDLKTGWITGQFAYENLPGESPDSLHVFLTDEAGNVIFEQRTDQNGNFDFRNLSLTENYILATEETDLNLVLFIFDKEGNVIAQLKQNESGSFIYRKIKSDYANDLQSLTETEDVFENNTMTLTGNFNYRKLEGDFKGGLEVMLYNEEGEFITSVFTDEKGEFRFTSLDPMESYLFGVNEENLSFDMGEFNLHVTNRYGETVADLYHGSEGFFVYRKLEAGNEDNLSTLQEKDFDFSLNKNTEAVIIFFDKNSSYPSADSYQKLAPIISYLKENPTSSVEISAYADSRAPDEYNLWLSANRGERIKNHLVRKGISASRIKIVPYGESKLINNCGNSIDCPEEEHAKNRRVEVVLKK